jgi:uncharacterized membrane protein YeaQ/YmgE (transglycosylase-associated protein family)
MEFHGKFMNITMGFHGKFSGKFMGNCWEMNEQLMRNYKIIGKLMEH